MYLTAACPFCQSAERLLAGKGVRDVEKIRVDLQPARRRPAVRRLAFPGPARGPAAPIPD